MNVKRLDGRLLNFWVATAAGYKLAPAQEQASTRTHIDCGVWHPSTFNPANDWSHAGAIVAAEWFAIEDALLEWYGPQWSHIPAIADHPLKWFMRAYVSTQFGDEVEDVEPVRLSLLAGDDPAPPLRDRRVTHTPSASKSFMPAWFRQINW